MGKRRCATFGFVLGLLALPVEELAGQADCNRNGTRDVEEVAAGLAEDCNGDGRPDECEVIPLTFTPAAPLPVASLLRDVASGDLDGDGRDDAVVVSRRLRGVSTAAVFFSRGERTFQETTLELAEDTRRALLVDLDADGDLDFASANRAMVGVLLNLGPGVFLEAVSYVSPAPVETLVAADLSGDGFPDVVAAAAGSDELVVFAGSGGGRLAEGVTVAGGDSPAELGAGDFDGDGDLDVAVVHRNGDTVGIYTGDGSGGILLSQSIALTSTRPFYLEVADMNSDGASDLVTMGAGVLEMLLQGEGGTFSAPVVFVARGSDLAVEDFDRDGDPDVAYSASGRDVSILFNDSHGKLTVAREVASGIVPNLMLAGDFDADGQTDLAYANTTRDSALNVLWSGAAQDSYNLRRVDLPLFGCRDTRGCRPHGGTSGDFDGDGHPEVLVSITHPGSFAVIRNDGAGNLEFLGNAVFGGEHPQSAAAGDIDGDGDLDALTADNLDHNVYVHANTGDGTFANPVRYPVGVGAISVRLYDLDADGFLDAIAANQSANTVSVLFNQGDGTFAAGRVRDYPVRGAPKSADGADFNGDGLGDLVSGNSGSARVTVFLGEADRSFKPRVDYPLSHPPHYVAVGDFDSDGDVDIAAALATGDAVAILPNVGDGTFGDATTVLLGTSPYSITSIDFDGDGGLDLITGNEASSSVSILLGEGDGTFGAARHFPAGTGLRFILPGDFDGDGDMDFGTSNREGNSVTVLYQESLGEVEDYRESICTPDDFHTLSTAGGAATGRFLKFLLPARDDQTLLPPLFQNTQRYDLHQDFFAEVFPERFPALTSEDYTRLVGLRATRDYFAGALRRLPPKAPDAVEGPDVLLYGFSVFADFRDPDEALSEKELAELYTRLRSVFRLETLVYAPTTRDAIRAASEWEALSFPVYLESAAPTLAFEAYTRGEGYGRVRRLSGGEFAEANELGQFGFQDILVLEEAPRDIEGVVAGIVTAQRQGELSHVAVRTARRGTPNAFVREAPAVFEPLEGKLVRLEVTTAGYHVEEATLAEAEDFWARSRPQLSALPAIDESFQGLAALSEIAEQEASGVAVEARFGGKASNLARLQTILEPPHDGYRMRAFAIPVYHYMQFLRQNRLPSAMDPARQVTYEEYIAELASAPSFQSDSGLRFEALKTLRDHMKRGQRDGGSSLDPDLIAALAARVGEVFGSTKERVRFRSSSNVEDAIEFNGAGLYDSTSVCVQDDLDGDDDGPSLCDSEREKERRIERGLRQVWASLWNFRAYEERAFYGLDQTQTAMGILVNPSFVAEEANGVAFTGNPSNGLDRRYVITAQAGEESVVSPDPGVVAEKNLLEITSDGRVARIIRATSSNLVPMGDVVLSDERLRELGALLGQIDRQLPVALGTYERRDILFDVEFKVTSDARLVPKQVRPFLLADPGPPPPSFAVVVPDAVLCGAFQIDRGLATEYELKSRLRLRPGALELTTTTDSYSAEWVEELVVGAAQEMAEPMESGLVRVRRFPGGDERITYSFEYEQAFVLPSGERCVLELGPFNFLSEVGVELSSPGALGDALLENAVFVSLRLLERDGVTEIRYLPCDFAALPRWDVVFEDAHATYRLEERFLEHPTETGPARVVSASISMGEQRRTVEDYWRLLYTAARHNERVSYRVVLDAPLVVVGIEEPVYAVDLIAPEAREAVRAAVHYLDAQFERLGQGAVTRFERVLDESSAPTPFLRGDSDGDGARTVADAVLVLKYLFQNAVLPDCLDGADTNDDGRLSLVDPITLLQHTLGRGPELAAPFVACGLDPSDDALGCVSFAACR